jgi:hypothetical protein
MTDRPTGPSVRSSRTSFPASENPISEGGISRALAYAKRRHRRREAQSDRMRP